jgi:hypothetical protein
MAMVTRDDAPEQYCRDIEAYLCRKNDGHLVRIVGPAFEQVCGWAARGVPIRVAYRGIDRYFERYYAKGPRRRPVRVEFCEADVLDAFDEWRRALGITTATAQRASGAAEPAGGSDAGATAGGGVTPEDSPSPRHGTLPMHLERVIARLTALRAGSARALDPTIETIVRELDAARGQARALRGDARQAFVARLRALDAQLMTAVRGQCDAGTLSDIAAEADEELAPFRGRLPEDAYRAARDACVERILRERFRLPVLGYEG